MNDDIVASESISVPECVEVYVLMVRYGSDYWAAHSTHQDVNSARDSAGALSGSWPPVWRIVRVSGLPVDVPEGKV